jgi:exopolysaccharide biosynthesis protein
MITKGATIEDSAAVTTALGLDFALNLDSGGSSAMKYVDGSGRTLLNFSGRDIPNAVIFKED